MERDLAYAERKRVSRVGTYTFRGFISVLMAQVDA